MLHVFLTENVASRSGIKTSVTLKADLNTWYDIYKNRTGTNTLWHVDPMLGNDREISRYTTAAAK
jgi:hypothetical protein